MPAQRSIAAAENAALSLKGATARLAERGQATPEELAQLDQRMKRLLHQVRGAHRDQRRAESILRTGREAVWITREFGPAEDYQPDADYLLSEQPVP